MPENELVNAGVVVLRLFDGDANLIEEMRIPVEAWYEDLHDVIDSSATRHARGISRIEGTQFDLLGQVSKRFTNTYFEDGGLIDYVEHNDEVSK